MAYVCRSAPAAGLEAILDVMPLDLFAQYVAIHAAFRIRGRNQGRWDGIGWDNLRGHLFGSEHHWERVNLGVVVPLQGKGLSKASSTTAGQRDGGASPPVGRQNTG